MKVRIIAMCLAALMACLPGAAQDNITINVKANKLGSPIEKTMYGIFFEDINYAADGGLYAELVKNRSFEFTPDHLMGWQAFGNVAILEDGPFEKNPHYAHLASAGHPDRWTGLQNEGFFGIGLHKDADYRFSVWARVPEGKAQMLRIQLIDEYSNDNNQELVQSDIIVSSKEWKRYTTTLKSPKTIDKAQLRIFLCTEKGRSGDGVCDVEHVSLFPADTWKGHENGMRKDLAQALYDLHPGVFRFPGGCIVEGTTLDNRYQWKNSIGPVENRPYNKNRWESTFTYRYYPDYFQSYGLGFYEYFLLSEEIGAEPLPVLNVGMACQFQNWNQESAHVPCTLNDLQPYIDDCNDLIEFANGDAASTWGKIRAEMGHPEPFNLKFIAIGNEQWGKFYFDRLKIVAEAVRKAHPEIKLIGTSGPDSEGENFDLGWEAMRKQKVDLVDEHFYRPIDWFLNNMNRYDNYDRKGPKVFAGEYACHDKGKKWNHAGASIYEAAFMTGLERNADIVHMATYAPLFAHVKGWQWRPDLIWFDNLRVAKSVSYHVQALYAQNKGTNVLPSAQSAITPKGEDGIFSSAVFDAEKEEYIVKIANTTTNSKSICIKMEGLKSISEARQITLDCSDYDKENTVESPFAVTPQEKSIPTEGNIINLTIGGKHFIVVKVKK